MGMYHSAGWTCLLHGLVRCECKFCMLVEFPTVFRTGKVETSNHLCRSKRKVMSYEAETIDEACRGLWTAVLGQAVRDAQGSVTNYIQRESARAWLRSSNQNVGSFFWVCSILNFDPHLFRSRLAEKGNPTTRSPSRPQVGNTPALQFYQAI